MIPETLKTDIEEQLGALILGSQMVSGGSIIHAAKIEVQGMGHCFLKWNQTPGADMFQKEVLGLQLLATAKTELVIPTIIYQGITADNKAYVLMEFLEQGSEQPDLAHNFGSELAKLHSHTHKQFGLSHDNYIGSLHQSNKKHERWSTFFIEERIKPQLKLAVDAGHFSGATRQAFQHFFKVADDIFPKEPASLLHGDLWGGNYLFTKSGAAAIFDPAVYYGNREIEIAFTKLFGGFANAFYASYSEHFSLEPGFDNRKDFYNLYPLLVHTNLFGAGYAQQVTSIIKKFNTTD